MIKTRFNTLDRLRFINHSMPTALTRLSLLLLYLLFYTHMRTHLTLKETVGHGLLSNFVQFLSTKKQLSYFRCIRMGCLIV